MSLRALRPAAPSFLRAFRAALLTVLTATAIGAVPAAAAASVPGTVPGTPAAKAPATTSAAVRALPVSEAAATDEVLARALRSVSPTAHAGRYIVVNLNARRLWYVDGDTVRFATSVAVGKGTRRDADAAPGEHATPRTRFTVIRRDTLPLWVPPDWHFAELSERTGRPLRTLDRGETLRARNGSVYYVEGRDVMRRTAAGEVERVALADTAGRRRELVVDGRIVVPPVGTTQREYPGVLGPRRLAFRDGYAIHGTDRPQSIGRAASHGCLRMRNEDVTALFDMIALGTPVFLQ